MNNLVRNAVMVVGKSNFVDKATESGNALTGDLQSIGLVVALLIIVIGAIVRMVNKEKGDQYLLGALGGAVIIIVATQIIPWLQQLFG